MRHRSRRVGNRSCARPRREPKDLARHTSSTEFCAAPGAARRVRRKLAVRRRRSHASAASLTDKPATRHRVRAVPGICEGRVVIVTGAGRGIGREHALGFAREGARVIVNDLGVEPDGTGANTGPAQQVVDEIEALGGAAIANTDDIADWDGALRLVRSAVDAFGALDVLVNNAGFVRDRMLFTTSEMEWDAVIRVHLKGHFAVTRHASEYWRERTKAGQAVDGRIVNTSSGAGLMGSGGQSAYSAAKGGIAALTLAEAAEMARYGATAAPTPPAP